MDKKQITTSRDQFKIFTGQDPVRVVEGDEMVNKCYVDFLEFKVEMLEAMTGFQLTFEQIEEYEKSFEKKLFDKSIKQNPLKN